MKLLKSLVIILLCISCKKEKFNSAKKELINDTIVLSNSLKKNKLIFDIDGDQANDTIELVKNTINKKSGLRIQFGSGNKVKYFGMGMDVLQQGFDDFDWIGVFEKIPKNKFYWNNVGEDGSVLSEEEIKQENKIKLTNDAIFMHQAESCGGGIIYFDNGEFKWIQQD